MKALTLIQPWASAISFGMKHYETRPRKTNHRGPLALHAGLSVNDSALANLGHLPWLDHIKKPLASRWSPVDGNDFPKGVIVAIADLTDCLLMDEELIASVSPMEAALGHWEVGRYAYRLENVKTLSTPVVARGKQGMWNVSDDDLTAINEQLG